MSLSDEAESGFVRAELRLSEEIKATYYTTPDGSQVTKACIRQFASSAVAMVRHFNTMRTAELKKLQTLLNPQLIEVSPPLILAYAVACSENLRGFVSTLKELRTDSRLKKLRTIFSELTDMSPVEAIETGRLITDEFETILGIKEQEKSKITELLFSVPKIFTDSAFGDLLLHGPDFLERFRIRRHLAILRKFHRFVPSIKQFYEDLVRVFGALAFDEGELRAWLTNPGVASPRLDTGVLFKRQHGINLPKDERVKQLKQLERITAQMFDNVNKTIRKHRVQKRRAK